MADAFQNDAFQDDAFQDVGGVQGITLGLLDAGPSLYAPTVTSLQVVVLGFLDAGAALYAPAVQLPATTRVTQVATEVLLTSISGQVRVSQEAVEVLRLTNAQGGSQVIIVG